jgi:glycosyltransferase involved in cell wall biosynthesis
VKKNEPYILWLPSWYPSKLDPYNGDFIQRHAKAASYLHKIHVLFVTEINMDESYERDLCSINCLTEEIIYFKKHTGFLSNLWKHYKWVKLILKTIEKNFQEKGKPLFVHVHVPWKAGLIALYLKKKYGLKYILSEHWGIYNTVVSDNFYNQPLPKRFLYKKIFNQAELFISVSNYLILEVNKIFKIKKSLIIPNVVDTAQFYFSNLKNNKFTFIHVSNMVALKNVGGILEAFYLLVTSIKHFDVQLVLIGNTSNEYEEVARSLGLLPAYVLFKGEISNIEVAEEMRKSHCFILNSNIENSPCVVGEALCTGLPIITTKVGGVQELFNENEGVFIPSHDTNSLLNSMCKMITEYNKYDTYKIAAKASKRFNFITISQMFNRAYKTIS